MIFLTEACLFSLILLLLLLHQTKNKNRREKRFTLIYFCPTTTYATVQFSVRDLVRRNHDTQKYCSRLRSRNQRMMYSSYFRGLFDLFYIFMCEQTDADDSFSETNRTIDSVKSLNRQKMMTAL